MTVAALLLALAAAAPIPAPEVRDPDLRIQLFAAEPDIVTPIGMAVDRSGRVFVVESHTHRPPPGYPGPPHDRIKIYEDTDGDGRADRISIFADGPFVDAMNVTFAPDGTLFVVTQNAVYALRDEDGDGRAEPPRTVLRLLTRQTYPHSGLLGVTVSHDGWLYVSRGNIGGYEYVIQGADGRRLPGYGDGGNVVRVRLDGGGLELVATGFWNPFDLRFDGAGRLLAVDNDPDSRGPNRLVHVIPGGDYGYRTRFGGSGLHPYSAWSGELPGTLGYAAGVGESPSGLLDCDTSALPARYRGGLLVTVWAENSIERFRPEPAGASFTARREVLIKGDRDFRPVAVAAAPDGTVYVTDWVKKDYPNHGHGRIWRLTAAPGVPRLRPRPAFAPPRPTPATARLDRVLALGRPADYPALRAHLSDRDPFVRAAAVGVLSRPAFHGRLARDLRHRSAAVRLGALLALRRAGGSEMPLAPAPPGALGRLLADEDEDVRKMALVWAGETVDLSVRERLRDAIARGRVSPPLFRLYLATVQLLTERERAHLAERLPRSTAQDEIDPAVALELLRDRALSPEIHALALTYLRPADAAAHLDLVRGFLAEDHLPVRLEAVRALAGTAGRPALALLAAVARDPGAPTALRAEAVAALAPQPDALASLADLVDDPNQGLALAAARLLRTVAGTHPAARAVLARRLERARREAADPTTVALVEALTFALEPARAFADPGRPTTAAAWLEAARAGGDPVPGRLVFVHPQVACSRCHAVGGRGGHIGPDLSHIASSVDLARLVDSLLDPSGEVSPEYQAYTLVKKTGETLVGSQFHFRGTDRASIRLLDGQEIMVQLDELASYEASASSFMPQGLENAMTVSEFRDLMAYLASLRE